MKAVTRLNEAGGILRSAYLDLVNTELKKSKPSVKTEPVKCRECGRKDVTLRKCSDGLYICEGCLKEGDDDSHTRRF